jgi:hypothetical protein
MILEAYDCSGLSRKLTGQDIAALESQAGFPADRSCAAASISEAQWREFEGQYHTVLKLLRQISSVGGGGGGVFGVCGGAAQWREFEGQIHSALDPMC